MFVHVNSLRYRIRRIEELTGRDLSSLEDQAALLLALPPAGLEEPADPRRSFPWLRSRRSKEALRAASSSASSRDCLGPPLTIPASYRGHSSRGPARGPGRRRRGVPRRIAARPRRRPRRPGRGGPRWTAARPGRPARSAPAAAGGPVSPQSAASTASACSSGSRSNQARPSRARPSAVSSPNSRSLASPPSGSISSRTWVARPGPGRADAQSVPGVRPQRGRRQQLEPFGRVQAGLARVAGAQRRRGRGVAEETRRVHDRLADVPRPGQPEQHPVVAVVAAPPGLPAVTHHGRPAGADHVLRRRVEQVAGAGDRAAVLQRHQVQRQPVQQPRVRHHLPLGAQPGDAAVGVDGEPQVSEPAGVGDREPVLAVAGQRRCAARAAPRGRRRPAVRRGTGSPRRRRPPPSTPPGSCR